MFRTIIVIAALSSAGLASSAVAQAANQTFTQTATFASLAGDQTNTPSSPVFYFNSALGTLNSITFSSSYGFTSTIIVSNPNSTTASGNARTQSAAEFGASDAAITSVLNSAVNTDNDPVDGTSVSFGAATLSPIAYDLRGTRMIFSLPPMGMTALTNMASSTMAALTDTKASDLSVFTKNDYSTFLPTLSTLSAAVISASPSAGGGETVTSNGSLTITYNYFGTAFTVPPVTSAVPEPATWAMVMLGVGAIGIGLRRRRSAVTTRVQFA